MATAQLTSLIVAKRNPLVCGACGANRGCGDCVLRRRPVMPPARSLLGSRLGAGRDAVDVGRRAPDFGAAFRGNGDGGRGWGGSCHLLPPKPLGIRHSRLLNWNTLRGLARGEKRLPICKHHSGDCNARAAIYWPVADRDSPLLEVSLGIAFGLMLSAFWPERLFSAPAAPAPAPPSANGPATADGQDSRAPRR